MVSTSSIAATIAKAITDFSQAHGGLLTADDLASYEPSWEEPISTTYRDYTVYCPPLPCSGMQYLETLNLVEGYDMAAMGQNSAEYIHTPGRGDQAGGRRPHHLCAEPRLAD